MRKDWKPVRDHGQNIVETCTPFGFSLFCPCCASLYLPQAALGSAPKEKKRQKKSSHSAGYGSKTAWKWRMGRLWPMVIRMLGMESRSF